MSSLSQFSGANSPPKSIVNSTSTTGATTDNIDFSALNGKKVSSGALTAATLSTILSVSGRGVIDTFACVGADATSRTHRLKMTVDGVVVYDATTAAAAATFRGIVLIGAMTGTTGIVPQPMQFNTSLLIEYASSLTETGKTNFSYTYRTL